MTIYYSMGPGKEELARDGVARWTRELKTYRAIGWPGMEDVAEGNIKFYENILAECTSQRMPAGSGRLEEKAA